MTGRLPLRTWWVAAIAALCVLVVLPTPIAGQAGVDPKLLSLIQFARQDIDRFWSGQIQGYRPPADVVMVTAPTRSECGAIEGPTAFYCATSNKIFWETSFFASQYRIGDFAPVFVLAHEWGHMVQRQLGLMSTSRGMLSIQLELQADCLAGFYAADARTRKVLEAGDDDEAAVSLRRAGDGLNSDWFSPRAHGTPGLRIDAFEYGFAGNSCLAQPFFDYLKVRGVDPARAPQQPTPTRGGLDGLAPQQAGRFTLTRVVRGTITSADAVDSLTVTYRTADGVELALTIVAHRTATDVRTTIDDAVRLLKEQGFREVDRRPITALEDPNRQVGVKVALQGANDVVLWSNALVVGMIRGPLNAAHELYLALPF